MELAKYVETDYIYYMNKQKLRSFDVLQSWRAHQSSYLVLSIMARDLLIPPVSTVASKFAFSAGGKTMTNTRSQIAANSLEVLMCIREWEAAEEIAQDWYALLEAEFKIMDL
ncbi:hypothetical protein ACOSP7_021528 [Xanthoceras sorbifolium]